MLMLMLMLGMMMKDSGEIRTNKDHHPSIII